MVRWATGWADVLFVAGNKPGADNGDVVVELSTPVAGMASIRCASGDLTVQVEAGQFIGVTLTLDDGRSLLVPWANVTAIIDAPAEKT
jgi:hypothetical protein